MNEKLVKEARSLVENITPMVWDCGLKCGAACCKSDEDGLGGMFLFPGEEALCGGDWADIVDADMGGRMTKMLVCDETCEREKRPLGCMIFPLTPVVGEDGKIEVRFDCRARPMCPLLRDGERGLKADFVEAVRKAMQLIAGDAEGLQFLRDWEALEKQFDFHL